jgi:hypothetical protein
MYTPQKNDIDGLCKKYRIKCRLKISPVSISACTIDVLIGQLAIPIALLETMSLPSQSCFEIGEAPVLA